MKQLLSSLICVLFLAPNLTGAEPPFGVSASLTETAESEKLLSVAVMVPAGHFLYADQFRVAAPEPIILVPKTAPVPEKKTDAFSGSEREVFARDFTVSYWVRNLTTNTLTVTVGYQGCDKSVCFLPDSKAFVLNLTAESRERASVGAGSAGKSVGGDSLDMLRGFTVVATRTGYANARDFLAFLDIAETRELAAGARQGLVQNLLGGSSLWFLLIGIILGGLALNLTPCVLPMIPINIAIIGAGAQSGSRARGFLLGSLYGAGIALSYGVLGLIVVLTGSMFGAINASPWFSLGIAVLFLVLALAMFDVFVIDLSRFLGRAGNPGSGKSAVAVLFMGIVSALLAGACVAPVVVFVLVHSAGLYMKGNGAGLLLPFLLGVGMALPWPFVGAGLAFLPKPGKWMERVRVAFGVVILVAAVYYAFAGAGILLQRRQGDAGRNAPLSIREDGWLTSLPMGLAQAREQGKPVLVDFWAGWCKSCHVMDATTFKDPEVRKRMLDFVAVKYSAETPDQPPHKQVLDAFGVFGLPTYVILKPSSPSVNGR